MIRAQQLNTAVLTALVTILQLEKIDTDSIGLEIENVGAAALNDFDVAVRYDPDGQWNTVATVSGDYTTPLGFIFGVGIDLTTLAGGTKSWIEFKGLYGVEGLRLQAKCGTSTTVSVRGKAQ